MLGRFLLGIICLSFSFIFSCSTTEERPEGAEYMSAYICPMQCEGSGDSHDGSCPVCSREYIPNDLHGHAEDFESFR